MRNRVVLALAAAIGVAAFPAITANSRKKPAAEDRQFLKQIPNDQKILQALNRLTFGPRPGDAQAVKSIGLKKWIEQQLHPESITEDSTLIAKLQTMDTLRMSGSELVRNYPTPQMVQQMVRGQLPMPTDPDRKLMLTRLVARYEQRQAAGADPNAPPTAPDQKKLAELLAPQEIRTLRTGTPRQKVDMFLALSADKQDELIAALPVGMRQNLFAVAPPEVRRRIEMANGPQQVVA